MRANGANDSFPSGLSCVDKVPEDIWAILFEIVTRIDFAHQ